MQHSEESAGLPAQTKKKSWKRRAVGWAVELVVVVALIWGVSAWQARHLLAEDTAAPDFTLASLEGPPVQLKDSLGKKTVLYFFAPWCSVCEYASHNIVALRDARPKEELAVYAVGLAWESKDELRQFAADHRLNVPVLMGDSQVGQNYQVGSFPTIYILDDDGSVTDRMVGYTTELSLRLRSL